MIKQVIYVPNLNAIFWCMNHKKEGGKIIATGEYNLFIEPAVLCLVEEQDKNGKYHYITPYTWGDGEYSACVDDEEFVDLSFKKEIDKEYWEKRAISKFPEKTNKKSFNLGA